MRQYVSSARLPPERFAEAVCAHWAIENSLHWVLDVTFDEDRARLLEASADLGATP